MHLVKFSLEIYQNFRFHIRFYIESKDEGNLYMPYALFLLCTTSTSTYRALPDALALGVRLIYTMSAEGQVGKIDVNEKGENCTNKDLLFLFAHSLDSRPYR